MKTATITFHASHNYGSMLQAFALQQAIRRLGHENKIINFRTQQQRNQYARPYDKQENGLKKLARIMLSLGHIHSLDKKYDLFECFLKEQLDLTEQYSSLEELVEAHFDFDCYISGGDQIWNTSPADFNWSYFLPFVKQGKRISYAVSMGPHADQQVQERQKIQKLLSHYDHISVRETGTRQLIQSMTEKDVTISLDPAFLLSQEEWATKYRNLPLPSGEYILMYSPVYNKDVYSISQKIAKKWHIQVICTTFVPQTLLYPSLKLYLATGPWEFLNLLANAKLVISGSFHALVFSILFQTPFFAVNGDKDNRMHTLLKTFGLANRTITSSNYVEKMRTAFECNFGNTKNILEKERFRSLQYLDNAIKY